MKRILFALLLGAFLSGGGAMAQGRAAARGGKATSVSRIQTVRLDDPILVFYREKPPGNAAQQLVMDAKVLPQLAKLPFEELIARPDIYFDGIDNREIPGSAKNKDKLRLVGSYGLSNSKRQPAGDGRSQYVHLRKPKQGVFYVFQDDASQYRSLVNDGHGGSRVDFQANVLPGIDSVRAVYVLRLLDPAQRGASIR
ncbi:hypothetical protein [Hymenobacter sp. DG25B]|jgi:hypothetical protein|uniref:hypothetical protein n=1 Tax=Hymenobacter sp. DG25B TaxID=1385664 RepID=UPI0012DFFC88|nr:hypothetical protein [Hymenobacter sp. DG25B]